MKIINELQLAKELIRFPTVTPIDAGIMKFLEKKLKKLGFKTKILEFKEKGNAPVKNLYARLGNKSPNFCYAGHLDVVPAGNLRDWTVNPFKPSIKNGHLIGRGANDMKSSIAAFVSAISVFVEKNRGFNGSISLLITGDEEGVAINGTKKVVDYLKKKREKIDFSTKTLIADTNAAIELFISLAPLPIKCPFLIVGLNGFTVQSFKFPAGTTSRCPA